MNRTKIIATIGPASGSLAILNQLVKNGMDTARLNFSHGDYNSHALLIRHIRSAAKKAGRPIGIIQDLQGPKIRVAQLAKPVIVRAKQHVAIGETFVLDFDIAPWVKTGQRILIQDGLIQLKVLRVGRKDGRKPAKIICEVMNGGTIESHKGINLPDSILNFPTITDKDKADLQFGLAHDVDWIAQSFVQSSKDILAMRKLIEKHLPKGQIAPKIIAKIERKDALNNLRGIIEAADAVMVARGDLGVEIPDDQVPVIQKTIIQQCLELAKPVIVATQMLESMVTNPRPTRAEVSDVANAVIDRADCVMLSEETAFGKYPAAAVKEMAKIINTIESSDYAGAASEFSGDKKYARVAELSQSACELAGTSHANAIVSATDTGLTSRFLSRPRPKAQIIVLTDKEKVCRQMTLLWGIRPVLSPRYHTVAALLTHAISEIKRRKLVKKGSRVVLVAANPVGQKINMLEVRTV